jgi:hypothetical protein
MAAVMGDQSPAFDRCMRKLDEMQALLREADDNLRMGTAYTRKAYGDMRLIVIAGGAALGLAILLVLPLLLR